MKKIRATRLMAMVMAVCMVLALAVPASALTTNYLELNRELVSRMLTDHYQGLLSRFCKREGN